MKSKFECSILQRLTCHPWARRSPPLQRGARIPRRRIDPSPTSEERKSNKSVKSSKFSQDTIFLDFYLVSILVGLPLGGKRVSLFVVEVFLQVEEGVKEDRGHLALLQVLQGDGVLVQRPDHVQHLRGEDYMRLKTQERERGQNLAKTVVEGKSFDSELLHSLQLLLVEVFQLIPRKKRISKSDKRYT